MASTNIEVEMRDNHLRSAELFDFKKYTKMTCKIKSSCSQNVDHCSANKSTAVQIWITASPDK